jgi:hypothetical protein
MHSMEPKNTLLCSQKNLCRRGLFKSDNQKDQKGQPLFRIKCVVWRECEMGTEVASGPQTKGSEGFGLLGSDNVQFDRYQSTWHHIAENPIVASRQHENPHSHKGR